MEDVSRLAGKIVVTWAGSDYALEKATIETWGTLQGHLMREKRARIISSALDLRGTIPDDQFDDLKRDALNEAGNVNSLSQRDVAELMNTEDGAVLLWWVLFEQTYKGKFSRKDVRQMISDGAIDNKKSIAIAEQIQEALGVGKSGNSGGQASGSPSDSEQAQ